MFFTPARMNILSHICVSKLIIISFTLKFYLLIKFSMSWECWESDFVLTRFCSSWVVPRYVSFTCSVTVVECMRNLSRRLLCLNTLSPACVSFMDSCGNYDMKYHWMEWITRSGTWVPHSVASVSFGNYIVPPWSHLLFSSISIWDSHLALFYPVTGPHSSFIY